MEDFKEQNLKTYEAIAADYSKANFKPFWVGEFEKYKQIISGKKVLDIGCGAGRDAVVFVGRGFEYVGIDASPAMLAVAKSRAPGGVYQQMDFYHLAFPDNSFDGFWAAASFLHVPKADLATLLLEAKRVVKPGGVGFVSVKEKDGMDEGMIRQERHGESIARYFAFYEKEEFAKYITDAGFEILEEAIYHEDTERHTVWLGFLIKKP